MLVHAKTSMLRGDVGHIGRDIRLVLGIVQKQRQNFKKHLATAMRRLCSVNDPEEIAPLGESFKKAPIHRGADISTAFSGLFQAGFYQLGIISLHFCSLYLYTASHENNLPGSFLDGFACVGPGLETPGQHRTAT